MFKHKEALKQYLPMIFFFIIKVTHQI